MDYSEWKVGDKVLCKSTGNIKNLEDGKCYTIIKPPHIDTIYSSKDEVIIIDASSDTSTVFAYRFELVKEPTLAVVKHIENISDVVIKECKEFIEENKQVFFWTALILIADQFIFEGKFRHKINDIIKSLIDKIKLKVDSINI